MDKSYFYAALSGGGWVSFIICIIWWIRFKRLDKAKARKTNAESFQLETTTWSEGYRKLIEAQQEIQQEQRKMFMEMLDQEREDCDKKLQELKGFHGHQLESLQRQISLLNQQLNNKT